MLKYYFKMLTERERGGEKWTGKILTTVNVGVRHTDVHFLNFSFDLFYLFGADVQHNALCMVCMCSATELYPQPHFYL
jgi:hypothetical protein